ncbi:MULTISPECIES: NRDE family protein [Acinetobacter]|uniref:NRDE family protein n=1 Tax=Acinetobacter ursingii TaxID=108980 RepID=A0A7T9UL37_9GAMM|nr:MULTISPECIES: NRDE family protein [Acinetobacter]EXD35941.1 NRDE family protein [Acinetobacter sp. 479375]MCH2016286.1 NRDE family protein [Acinetobacter ursingii]MCU4523033.1 NRDE family protein [Acinetobacter ursingii]MCU4588794.1 NRDE family protein [Acinetobacter ursingii]QQT87768.1 NRDE family protein [Acinetobacter ursingii]
MCIVALAWQVLEQTPICLLSNRDEFYARPTTQLYQWSNLPIVAGQDLQSGGTWMGVTASGRWAVVTNFRDGQDKKTYDTSRGALVEDFLLSDLTPIRFAQQLEQKQHQYAGFNLFMGDQAQAVYMSNRGEAPQVLAKGVYVVSNGLMSEHWEKTAHLRKRFTQEFLPMLQDNANQDDIENAAWDILEDERQVIPELLPATGISPEMEQLLSSTFIQSPIYGTRCSNFLNMRNQQWNWLEKTQAGELKDQIIDLNIPLNQQS